MDEISTASLPLTAQNEKTFNPIPSPVFFKRCKCTEEKYSVEIKVLCRKNKLRYWWYSELDSVSRHFSVWKPHPPKSMKLTYS